MSKNIDSNALITLNIKAIIAAIFKKRSIGTRGSRGRTGLFSFGCFGFTSTVITIMIEVDCGLDIAIPLLQVVENYCEVGCSVRFL